MQKWYKHAGACLVPAALLALAHWLSYEGVSPLWVWVVIGVPLGALLVNMVLRAGVDWPSAIATSLPLLPLSVILSSWMWSARVARAGGPVEVLPGVAWVGAEDVVPAGLVFGGAAGIYLRVVCALMAWAGTHIAPRQADSPRP
ncbi:hypothetical protein Tter_1887 [Thermobaculum terrenum ATCC BAA-798]|uniref:Uncharacterized protein n=1 Tax=Thermobaculum terrenum (strain ATCC BAA-798 / CCMEE 7001 / YNP1) TaxID=525904 RepID=D1CGC2_THET1|nr:hypothetical protein [Thermobaculum terrenum]ACZ42793.1 hypothetical protein Tter_1887 [Thermobaculum terrenum ATCC BAA-798]